MYSYIQGYTHIGIYNSSVFFFQNCDSESSDRGAIHVTKQEPVGLHKYANVLEGSEPSCEKKKTELI